MKLVRILALSLGLVLGQSAYAATQLPPGMQCFQATTGVNGMVGTLGPVAGGSSYTNGTYGGVALTGGSGSGATANIVVSGGAVTSVTILNPGTAYVVGDALSAAAASIGGTGSGFSVGVLSVSINSSLAGGTVGFYIPNTQTFKQTWQDQAQTILNTNPVALNQNGCAVIFGNGVYRQILKDSLGNTVWDKLTYDTANGQALWGDTASGTANALTVNTPAFNGTDGQVINFIVGTTNTGAATLNPSSFGAIPIYKNAVGGAVPVASGDLQAGNIVSVVYDAGALTFYSIQAVSRPPGRAIMFPNPGQTSGNWNALDPYGTQINCGSSSSQCLQEFINYTAARFMPAEVYCPSTSTTSNNVYINSSATIQIPPIQHWTFKAYNCTLNFGGPVNTPGLKFNSAILLDFTWTGQIVYGPTNPGAQSYAVLVQPQAPVPIDGIIGFADSKVHIATIACPASGGNAVAAWGFNPDLGAIITNFFSSTEINGTGSGSTANTNFGVVVFGPTASFEQNIIDIADIHLVLQSGIQVGVNATNQGNMRRNVWRIGGIAPAGAGADGFNTFGSYDIITIGGISNLQGTLARGVVLEPGTNSNVVTVGQVTGQSGAALVDSGTLNWVLGSLRNGTFNSTNGVVHFPDGSIGQYVNNASASVGGVTASFPIPFTSLFTLVVTPGGSTPASFSANGTASNFTIYSSFTGPFSVWAFGR